MAAASFQFLAFALGVIVVFNLGRSAAWRQIVLLLASFAFLAFFSLNPMFGRRFSVFWLSGM